MTETVLRSLGGTSTLAQQMRHPRILTLSLDGTSVENDDKRQQEQSTLIHKPHTVFLKHKRDVKPMTPFTTK